jgi:hypothetical protein
MSFENEAEADTGVFQMTPMDKWLVRTEKNQILGPFSAEKVRQMILQGSLNAQDEVCQANTYWFYLHEADEVQKQLNVQVPRSTLVEEKGEQTETAIDLRISRDIQVSQNQAAAPENHEGGELIPDLDGHLTEETAVLNNRALRQFTPRKNEMDSEELSDHAREFFRVSVMAHTERPSYWRIFVVFLAVGSLALLGLMIWLLSVRAKV